MLAVALVLVISAAASANDITGNVFGNISHGVSPAAFGDFNSDKLTDIFVIRDDGHAIEVLLAGTKEPIMQPSNLTCYFPKGSITSVVPGDFDGDAVMDILVTTKEKGEHTNTSVFILWGAQDSVECPTDESHPVLSTKDQPLVLDFNDDMISDLFGQTSEGKRMYWIFGPNRTAPREYPMAHEGRDQLRYPHSHAFVDLDGDFVTDLVLTTDKGFEVWNGIKEGNLTFNRSFNYPEGVHEDAVGQNLFLDVALNSQLELVLPVCFNARCENSTIFIYDGVEWRDLRPNFKDPQGNTWGFVKPDGHKFTDVITPRGGDFNLDGYPDLLVTLTYQTAIRTVLLENVHGPNGRTFSVQWTLLGATNNTVAGAFFDFYQKGIMDVLLVQRITHDKQDTSALIAFKNGLDYDANFLKVTYFLF
jgi:integrin alpha FG-GAP repeat containing protein 1